MNGTGGERALRASAALSAGADCGVTAVGSAVGRRPLRPGRRGQPRALRRTQVRLRRGAALQPRHAARAGRRAAQPLPLLRTARRARRRSSRPARLLPPGYRPSGAQVRPPSSVLTSRFSRLHFPFDTYFIRFLIDSDSLCVTLD